MTRSTWLAMVFLLATATADDVGSAEKSAETNPAPVNTSRTTEPPATEGAPVVAKIESTVDSSLPGAKNSPIRTLLIDKEFPLTGIKWGGQIFVDFPLNDEPEEAQITLRRAQLAFWRKFGANWSVKLTALYNSGDWEISDNYVVYSGWETAVAQLGVFDPQFSLESLSSSTGLTFMERSLPVYALSENKSGGLGVLKRTRDSIISTGLFLVTPREDNKSASGQALVMRYVHSPVDLRYAKAVHLGGSFSYRINVDPSQTDLKSRPEIATADEFFVDAGDIAGLDKVFRFGLEACSVTGRFSWQAELLSLRAERVGYADVKFNGAYAFASWFLTEDSRNYDAGTGEFNPVSPGEPLFRGGKGALELAARASYVDLNDEDIVGGRETNISLGLNWYLNSQLRAMTNVVKVFKMDRPGSPYDGETPWILALRLQWQLQ